MSGGATTVPVSEEQEFTRNAAPHATQKVTATARVCFAFKSNFEATL